MNATPPAPAHAAASSHHDARPSFRDRRVGVLMGGPSSEREVSLKTGKPVLAALLERGYDAVAIDWRAGENLATRLLEARVDVVWNALHGVWGEDGCVQGLLECLGLPYTGSGVMGSATAMDKVMSKRIFESVGVPTAAWHIVPAEGSASGGAAEARLLETVGLPAVVKPSREGSSVGVTIVKERAGLAPAIAVARRHHGEVLIEAYVAGRELNVGILDGEVLGDVEVRPATEFYDYEAKYLRDDTQYICPAPLTEAERQRVGEVARLSHTALGCAGYSRVDLLLGHDGRMVCLEVNTLPGMTDHSLLPKIAASRGMDYATLVERILAGASLKA